MRRRILRHLIWVCTVCSGLSVRIHMGNMVYLRCVMRKGVLWVYVDIGGPDPRAQISLCLQNHWGDFMPFHRFLDNNFYDFLFVFLYINPFLKRKEFAPLGTLYQLGRFVAIITREINFDFLFVYQYNICMQYQSINSFLFRVDLFSEVRQKQF